MKLPFGLSWLNIITGGLPILVLAGVFWGVHHHGYNSGKAEVQADWNVSKLEIQKEANRLKAQLEKAKATHATEMEGANNALAIANQNHAAALASLRAGHALRMRDSEARAQLYQRMSVAGPAESAGLASHAGQLDRALEEGRRLVGELRSTLEQRDTEVRALAEVIRADRKLMSETNGN